MQLNIARLATTRTSERTIASGIIEHPGDPSYGKIIYIIDIPLPLVVGEPVERTILSTLQEEYFAGEKKYPVYQFEDALKQVNAALAELAEDGSDEWVGHIHGIIALWANNEIFLTYTGRVVANVARSGTLVSVIDPGQQEKRVLVHKTFANLASGTMAEGDMLILGNGEVNRHFSPQFLSQCASMAPTVAIQHMVGTARRLNLTSVTAVIGRVEPDQESDDDILSEPETVVVNDNSASLIPSADQIKENLNKSFDQVGQTLKNVRVKDGWTKVYLTVKTILHPYLSKLSHGTKVAVKTIKSPEKLEVHFDDNEVTSVTLAPPALTRSSSQKINDHYRRFSRKIASYFQAAWHSITSLPPKVLLCVGVVLLILVVWSSWKNTHRGTNAVAVSGTEAKSKFDQIAQMLSQATAQIKNQPPAARQTIITAENQLQPLLDQKSTVAEAKTYKSQFDALLYQINNIVPIDTKQSVEISSGITNFVVLGQYLINSRDGDNNIYRQTLGSKDNPQIIYSLPGKVSVNSMILKEKERQVVAVGSDNKIYIIPIDSTTKSSVLNPPDAAGWPAIQYLGWYQTNLYILEKGSGTIWKFISTDGLKYAAKQPYLASPTLADPGSQSFTGDGNIYILNSSGGVTKMTKGRPQNFGPITIPDPDAAIKSARGLFTDDTANSVYLIDANRIIEVNKDGLYVRQDLLSEGQIDKIFVSPRSKKAWILSGTKLIIVSL